MSNNYFIVSLKENKHINIDYLLDCNRKFLPLNLFDLVSLTMSVSYTHLDVYKRQPKGQLIVLGKLRNIDY